MRFVFISRLEVVMSEEYRQMFAMLAQMKAHIDSEVAAYEDGDCVRDGAREKHMVTTRSYVSRRLQERTFPPNVRRLSKAGRPPLGSLSARGDGRHTPA